ncbi:MAG: L-tyrosine/L-tryptophan isonitrile synthase family protein [Candidatus Dojkabacteria bacterium]|nr:MAG: L-tyrosine/L-tryptophan isonitrile synthase family protein [Candidatus Dojkabacteria bacterium]
MQNDVLQFLKERLEKRYSYNLTPKDKRKLDQNPADFIFERITSGKFKKTKADELTAENCRKKIDSAVSSNLPIKFTFPFGGYKLHSLPSAPMTDWAEFFMIAYYADFLNQIAEHYKPGVELAFSSDEVIINRLDNIPQGELDGYTDSFKEILHLFNQHLAPNLKIVLQRVRDLYESEEEFEKELQKNMNETKDNWDGFDDVKKAKRKSSFILNYNFAGEEDRTDLNQEELEDLLRSNTQLHDAYGLLSKRKDFVRGSDVIVLFTTPIPDAITLGTTRYSAVKFWTGFGVLKRRSSSYEEHVLSPKQLSLMGDFEEVRVDSLTTLKNSNLHTIRIYE